MALTATDRNQNLRMNGSGTHGRVAPRREAAKSQLKEGECCMDGLPRAFLHSLRTLFDILDDSGRGYVHISEIESRWRGADTAVLGCLRSAAPPHGCLSFQRFVAGLRRSMLNPENHVKAPATVLPQPAPKQPPEAGPAPQNKVRPLGPSNLTNTQAPRRPEEAARPGAAPHYTAGRAPEPGCYRPDQNHVPRASHPHTRAMECLDLESPRLSRPSGVVKSGLPRSQSESATGLSSGSRRHGRSRDEQRRHTISNGVDYSMRAPPPRPLRPTAALMVVSRVGPRGLVQAEDSFGPPGPTWTAVWAAYTTVFIPLSNSLYSSKAVHFFLWLKQMKELEQEKDSLLAGLEVVERAREWYQSQIHHVTERQRHIGQSSQCTDFFNEATQCRINVLIPKLQEVNRCLSDLITCTGMPVSPSGGQTSPLSCSTQPPPPAPPPAPPQAIQRLKDQNRLLTQEVSDKSDRITQLEQEKSALIKQLFEARARLTQDTSALDSTFI